MSKIIQTPQQRANTLEALNVMWPSVPPENVYGHLGFWRDGGSFEKEMNCNTTACFGGWCVGWPTFKAQGVSVDGQGMPHLGNRFGTDVALPLFGLNDVFMIRGFTSIDDGFKGTDHELVTHRLQWLLDNSEVKP